ncbi:MAG: 50S ribosomal protein L17, large subunit ribosomal protein L17 [Candidatus Gottesmanbacteria bacterium GW2011_GWA2_43_14]|uniref:50S ribosomal protein L17 n=1 Tax=Candidatus Gottesmanbacteria bacterium GW2011_GWA2_43_14 TaxID=1618443 RepID=A0A0G1GAQ6_9BACT|nr:MAG: 50S ribosomal protein L17, large subunit ribosomal protein L17 [Candidatus Gottesmanbacteria bacterium GW2011_GWA2_43_14]
MRHNVFGRKLNRDVKERKALFRSLVNAFIEKGRIKTTKAKAKAVISLIEKLVTKSKDGSRASMTVLMSFFNRKEPVHKLTHEIAPRFKDKVGGYIRMIQLGRRHGDNAQEVLLEWTVPEPVPVKAAKVPAAKKTAKPEAKKEVKKKGKK